MPGDAQLEELLAIMRRDGMVIRKITVPTTAVVVVKAIIEAYPGLASVHAARGRAPDERTMLFIASSPQVRDEVAGICDDLSAWGVEPARDDALSPEARVS